MNVQIGKYKGFGLKRPDINVTNEEINDYIYKIREKYQINVEKESSIEKGDYIAISYDGYYEGEHIPQISRKSHHSKIGEGYFLDEFEQHLLGLKKGDHIEFDLVLGNDCELKYLRNETVHFQVKVLSVMNRMVPELTDDVVRNFKIEGITTIEQLKEHAKDQIYYQKMMAESTKVINEIMHRIIEGSKVDLEDEKIQQLKDEIFENFKKQLEKNNANLEIYLSYTKKTEEELLQQCELEAKTYLTEKEIIEKIAQIENIILNNEEKEKYTNHEDKEALNQLLYQKVIHFLLKENTAIIK